jgi:hypothetical protein
LNHLAHPLLLREGKLQYTSNHGDQIRRATNRCVRSEHVQSQVERKGKRDGWFLGLELGEFPKQRSRVEELVRIREPFFRPESSPIRGSRPPIPNAEVHRNFQIRAPICLSAIPVSRPLDRVGPRPRYTPQRLVNMSTRLPTYPIQTE